MTLGGRCTNADFKGYRADVAARVGGSVWLDKGQGNFWGFTVFGGQDRVTIFQRSTVFCRDGQSRPALRQCSYFLSFLRHNSTNSTAEHSASTNKSAGRAASPVCGIRNVGAVVCAGGVAGGVSSAGVCALTGAGIVLACSGVNRPLSSSCGTKGESKGKGSEFFHG